MGPRLLNVSGDPPDPGLLRTVARHLEEGGLIAMPTETVYGFGGAAREGPLKALQRLKGRGGEKPFLLLVPDMEAVSDLTWTPAALELARVFWPGALTLVLRDEGGRFPLGVRSVGGTVAVRQSPHPVARGLVESLGEPLISRGFYFHRTIGRNHLHGISGLNGKRLHIVGIDPQSTMACSHPKPF